MCQLTFANTASSPAGSGRRFAIASAATAVGFTRVPLVRSASSADRCRILDPPNAPVKAVVSAPANGEILETNAYYVEATGAWRMMVLVRQVDAKQPVELRAYLQNGENVLTETWSNLVPPR